MPYLFDADALITSNNAYYPIEFVPGFWELLLRGNANGEALSIENVFHEVQGRDDDVAAWATANKHFFLPLDSETSEMTKIVANYVNRLALPITEPAKRTFLSGADSFLIAYAIVHSHTIVTCEKEGGIGCKKIKIPDVCSHFAVRTINPMKFVRELRACLSLSSGEEPL